MIDREMAAVPGQLVWEIVRNNNCFLVKQFGRGNAKVQFSKEPNNLYNLHSYKYSGKFGSIIQFISIFAFVY
jgi:large subunit ribosomal protein L28e